MTDKIGRVPAELGDFVRESNYIEGIHETTDAHIIAHVEFLGYPISVLTLRKLVSVLQPDARFRDCATVPGVRVGNHVAPPSGLHIAEGLQRILTIRDPWEQHVAYETLHPFTDGNGRSGRALWLHRHWHEGFDPYAVQRGFLHSFYYHTLSSVRPNREDQMTDLIGLADCGRPSRCGGDAQKP